MNKKTNQTKQLAFLGLLFAIVFILSETSLGTIPIGPLSITLNMIPVAISAIVLREKGGVLVGGFFGLLSFLQALGIGVPSVLGGFLVSINPFFTFIVCFGARVITGYLLGLVSRILNKNGSTSYLSIGVVGFLAPLLNFTFFMGFLWLLFGFDPTFLEYLHSTLVKTSMAVFVGGIFVSNTILEIVSTTILVGVICGAFKKAKML